MQKFSYSPVKKSVHEQIQIKCSLQRPRKLKDNIKMDIMAIGCEDGKWMELALE
jgi:hypothetical protein